PSSRSLRPTAPFILISDLGPDVNHRPISQPTLVQFLKNEKRRSSNEGNAALDTARCEIGNLQFDYGDILRQLEGEDGIGNSRVHFDVGKLHKLVVTGGFRDVRLDGDPPFLIEPQPYRREHGGGFGGLR